MGPRVYPSDQNVSQLLPSPTVGPGTPTPTPVPTSTPTPTPTPTPGIPISTPNLRFYVDGQSISYPGTGTTWYNLATPAAPGYYDGVLYASPPFTQTTSKNYFSFNGLTQWTSQDIGRSQDNAYDYSYTWGGWFRLSRGPIFKSLMAFGIGLEYTTDFYGCPLNLFKDNNDYLAVQLFKQIDPTPSTPRILTGTTLTSTTKLPNDLWSYIVAVYSKNSQMQLYLNGSLIGTVAVPSQGHLIWNGLQNTNIGWNLCYGGYLGDAIPSHITRMDAGDMEVYQTGLSGAQILSNYNAQLYKYI
jgi:hypothetical protein